MIKMRLRMPFTERAKLAKSPAAKKLFDLAIEKRSLLCVAADVRTSAELLDLARKVGPHICMFKTHFDILEDFTEHTKQQLVLLAKNFNFMILEDR